MYSPVLLPLLLPLLLLLLLSPAMGCGGVQLTAHHAIGLARRMGHTLMSCRPAPQNQHASAAAVP
jgi:hypothetical protein